MQKSWPLLIVNGTAKTNGNILVNMGLTIFRHGSLIMKLRVHYSSLQS